MRKPNPVHRYRLTCECSKCGNPQNVSISALLSCDRCNWDLNRPAHLHPEDPWPEVDMKNLDAEQPAYTPDRCEGRLVVSASDEAIMMANMLSLLLFVRDGGRLTDCPVFSGLIDQVAEDASEYLAPPETPQQMGWVGSNGLP